MKKRTAVAPMKSVLAKGAPKFTARDRELFAAYQQPGEGDMLSPREFSDLTRGALHTNGHPSRTITLWATKWVGDRWGVPDLPKPTPLSYVWRIHAAYGAISDNLPEREPDTDEALRTALEATKPRVDEILDAISLYELEAGDVAGAYHIATRADTDEFWIDPANVAKSAREQLAELRAMPVIDVDQFYTDRIVDRGRGFANHVILNLRATGALEKLRATKGRTMILDREEFERQITREKFDCCDPNCDGCGVVDPVTWSAVEDVVEDGRVAVIIRDEESAITRRMKHVMLYNAPSTVENGEFEQNNRLRVIANGYEVRP